MRVGERGLDLVGQPRGARREVGGALSGRGALGDGLEQVIGNQPAFDCEGYVAHGGVLVSSCGKEPAI